MNSTSLRRWPDRQRGFSTLLVAILLLGILTVISLFALSVGVFEQRTSVNDARSRLVHAAAEAGLNQGSEFIKANKKNVVGTNGNYQSWMWATTNTTRRWVLCSSTDTSFPCGAETDTSRRARLWRYQDTNKNLNLAAAPSSGDGTARSDVTGTAYVDETRTLNFGAIMPNSLTTAYNAINDASNTKLFDVTYYVGALLCMIDPTTGNCVDSVSTSSPFVGQFAVTLVSQARLTSATGANTENASATHKMTVALYPAINGAPNVPIIASGSVSGTGSAEIVPNENAGGFGVPVSIWTNSNADFSSSQSGGLGAAQTCHLGEWLTNYSGGNGGPSSTTCFGVSTNTSTPTLCEGVTVCTKCKCDGLLVDRGLLTGKATQAAGAAHQEGIDVLDMEATSPTVADTTCSSATNCSVLPNMCTTAAHPFAFPYNTPNISPCDTSRTLSDPNNNLDDSLFEYVFGAENSSNTDSSLEDLDGNGLDDGDDYMINLAAAGAAQLIDTATACTNLINAGANASGLYFVKAGVSCHLSGQIGSPSSPVGIVVDSQDFKLNGNTLLFGMLFIKRYLDGGTTTLASSALEGGAVVYGSVVNEGNLDIRGSVQIVYNGTVLDNLKNNPANGGVANVPGSWSDNVSLQ